MDAIERDWRVRMAVAAGIDPEAEVAAAERIESLLRSFEHNYNAYFEDLDTQSQQPRVQPHPSRATQTLTPYYCRGCGNMVIYKPCVICRCYEEITKLAQQKPQNTASRRKERQDTVARDGCEPSPTPYEIEVRARTVRDEGFWYLGRFRPPWSEEVYLSRSTHGAED